jgi:hypothetical protein
MRIDRGEMPAVPEEDILGATQNRKRFTPNNDFCLDCNILVNPFEDRQELAFDKDGTCRRRCGRCIE